VAGRWASGVWARGCIACRCAGAGRCERVGGGTGTGTVTGACTAHKRRAMNESNTTRAEADLCPEPEVNRSLTMYRQRLTCAQSQKRLRWGTGSVGGPLFIQENDLRIVHVMHKQRNKEKALEGCRSGQKHREASGETGLPSMTAPGLDSITPKVFSLCTLQRGQHCDVIATWSQPPCNDIAVAPQWWHNDFVTSYCPTMSPYLARALQRAHYDSGRVVKHPQSLWEHRDIHAMPGQ
jgi:hypothetical protein